MADHDREQIELTCHECGKTWTHTGAADFGTCPDCGESVPVENLGP